MKARQGINLAVIGIVLALSVIALLRQGGFSIVCQADCDPGGDAPDGVAYCTGDVNGDKELNIADPVSLLNHLFLGGPAPVAFAACRQTQEECDELEFGRCIAGSYISTTELGKMLTTFGANGSIVVSSNKSWNAHGTWRKTGPREVTALTMSFLPESGEPTTTAVVRTVSQFLEDCSERTVAMHVALYTYPSNPFEDPGAQPYQEVDYHHRSIKIK